MFDALSRTGRFLLTIASIGAVAAVGCVSTDAQQATVPAHDHAERALAGSIESDRFHENFAGQGTGLIARRLNTEFWVLYRIETADQPQYRVTVVKVPDWAEGSLLYKMPRRPFEGEIIVNADPDHRTLEFVVRGETLQRVEVRIGERSRRYEDRIIAKAAVSLTIDQAELDRLITEALDGAERDTSWHDVLFRSRTLQHRLGFRGRGPNFDCQAGGAGAVGATTQASGQRLAMEVSRRYHVCLGNRGTQGHPELWARAFVDR